MHALRKAAPRLGLATLAALGLAATCPQAAEAQVSGFGSGFTTNSNYPSGVPTISSDGSTLTLTNSGGSEATSAFYGTKQDVTNFTASFDYTDVNGGGADGVTFTLQNQSLNALGSNGSGLGYAGISPSAAIALNIYQGHTAPGTNLLTGGAYPSLSSPDYYNTSPANLDSGHPIHVVLTYDGSNLTETLTDTTNASDVFSHTYTGVNLAGAVGGSTAFVGFTGGTGGLVSTQTISNFAFRNAATPAPEPSSLAAFAFTGLGALGLMLRARKRTVAA